MSDVGFVLQVLSNAGMASEFWKFDDELGEIRESLDESLDDFAEAMSYGYREEHLRVVSLSVEAPIPMPERPQDVTGAPLSDAGAERDHGDGQGTGEGGVRG
jgi:hypothetical protein